MTRLSSDKLPSSFLLPVRSSPPPGGGAEDIGREANNYFLEHWPFSYEKCLLKFLRAGFPRVTCVNFFIFLSRLDLLDDYMLR